MSCDSLRVKEFIKRFVLAAGIKSEDASEGEYSKEALEVMETGAVESIPENNGDDSGSKPESSPDENGTETAPSIFTYDQLKAKSHNPVMGIDFKRREVCVFVPIQILCLNKRVMKMTKKMHHWCPAYCPSSKLIIDL